MYYEMVDFLTPSPKNVLSQLINLNFNRYRLDDTHRGMRHH